jgi:hypothetical protein
MRNGRGEADLGAQRRDHEGSRVDRYPYVGVPAPPGVFLPVPGTVLFRTRKARARAAMGRATQEEYARHTPMCSVSGARAMRLRTRRHCSRREAPVRFPGETPSWRPLHRRGKSIALGTSCADSSPPACMAASQAQGIVWERSTICHWRL